MSNPCTSDQPIAETLRQWAGTFDERFAALMEPVDEAPAELVEAMRYSALAGAKRLRPFLVTRFCEINGGTANDALPAAAAIECVHTFSLIHDDLPAMDDDDFRRGQPSNHSKFDEATAILAGDALLVLSFELILGHSSPGHRAAAVALELARGAGWRGMIGGQMADILGESRPPSRELSEYIHVRKTARLFEAGCRMGALVAVADPDAVDAAGRYGHHLGRAFQIADDLLDVTSTTGQMGKAVGKDAGAGKQTFHAIVGLPDSRAAAVEACQAAIAALEPFGEAADDLRALATFVVRREH